MSKSKLEFITAWNDIFSYKIKENELSKPTEKFVLNALISYLNQFNIHFDVASMMETKGYDLTFKIKFCKYIDHYYKLSDKSNSFLYYDLIHPSPKKTAHMLEYLLNYWLYYNMKKEDIMSTTHSKIKEYQNLLETKQNFIAENNKLEVKSKTIEKSIDECNALLPKLNVKIENLQVEKTAQDEKLKELQEKCKKCDNLISELKKREEDLRNSIVSQDEIDNLKINISSLEKQLNEQEEIEKQAHAGNQDRSQTITKLQPIIKKIELAMNMYPITDLTRAKELKLKEAELRRKHHLQISANKKKNTENQSYVDKELELKNILNRQRKILQETVNNIKGKIMKVQKRIEVETKLNESLDESKEKINIEIENKEEIYSFLVEKAKQMVEIL